MGDSDVSFLSFQLHQHVLGAFLALERERLPRFCFCNNEGIRPLLRTDVGALIRAIDHATILGGGEMGKAQAQRKDQASSS